MLGLPPGLQQLPGWLLGKAFQGMWAARTRISHPAPLHPHGALLPLPNPLWVGRGALAVPGQPCSPLTEPEAQPRAVRSIP